MLLLDTSFLIDYESELAARQVGPARTVLRQRPLEIVAVSLISVGEFAEGFSDAREVESFLSHFKVVTLSRVIASSSRGTGTAVWRLSASSGSPRSTRSTTSALRFARQRSGGFSKPEETRAEFREKPLATTVAARSLFAMPSTARRKSARVRQSAPHRLPRKGPIEPIPTHRVGSLPVTDLELELEKLAGPDQVPDFSR